MTTTEGSLEGSGHQERPDYRSKWQWLTLWAPERRKYWLILFGAAALAAVAAVVLVVTLGGSGRPDEGADESGSSNRFAPAATVVPGDHSQALTSMTSQSAGADGGLFKIEGREPVSAPAALAASQPGETGSYLATTRRQVISQATLSVEVAQVSSAVDQVRAIAESLGGFVEQLSSSGVAQEQHSTLTIRVPQTEFFNAFDRIKLLGEVVSEHAGSEDVTEQFIDLEARLKGAQREEESLLALLGQADKVGDILTIERELVRVRTELERLQGQINYLERRVDLATITVSLFAPQARFSEPPSAVIGLESKEVTSRVEETKALIVSAGGEVDQVFTSVRDGGVRASLTARVFARDFDRVLGSIESQGQVVNKDVREGNILPQAEFSDTETPQSVIDISFEEPEASGTNLALAAGAPAGSVAFAILLALLIYATYRAARRRSLNQG